MDYGHNAYFNTFSSRRHIVVCALRKLETRIAQGLYEGNGISGFAKSNGRKRRHAKRSPRKSNSRWLCSSGTRIRRRLAYKFDARKKCVNGKTPISTQHTKSARLHLRITMKMLQCGIPLRYPRGRYIDLIQHFYGWRFSPALSRKNVAGSANPSTAVAKQGKKSKSKIAKAVDASRKDRPDQRASQRGPNESDVGTKSERRRRLKEGGKETIFCQLLLSHAPRCFQQLYDPRV